MYSNGSQKIIRLIHVILVSIDQKTISLIYVIWYQSDIDNNQTNSSNIGNNRTQTTITQIHVIWVSMQHRQLLD